MRVILSDDNGNFLGSSSIEQDAAMWLMDLDNSSDWIGNPVEVNIPAGDVGGPAFFKVCQDDGDVLFEGRIGPLSAGRALDGMEHVFQVERTGWNKRL